MPTPGARSIRFTKSRCDGRCAAAQSSWAISSEPVISAFSKTAPTRSGSVGTVDERDGHARRPSVPPVFLGGVARHGDVVASPSVVEGSRGDVEVERPGRGDAGSTTANVELLAVDPGGTEAQPHRVVHLRQRRRARVDSSGLIPLPLKPSSTRIRSRGERAGRRVSRTIAVSDAATTVNSATTTTPIISARRGAGGATGVAHRVAAGQRPGNAAGGGDRGAEQPAGGAGRRRARARPGRPATAARPARRRRWAHSSEPRAPYEHQGDAGAGDHRAEHGADHGGCRCGRPPRRAAPRSATTRDGTDRGRQAGEQRDDQTDGDRHDRCSWASPRARRAGRRRGCASRP